MTTVYVDKRAGIVITDSRVTNTETRNLLGFIPLSKIEKFAVVNQKALYIHDRIFTGAGSVSEINKILQNLIFGTPVYPDDEESCHCLLIGKEYVIHLISFKGKFHKVVEFYKDQYWSLAIGSGSKYISGASHMGTAILTHDTEELCSMIIDKFRLVKNKDVYSDDNINIYRF